MFSRSTPRDIDDFLRGYPDLAREDNPKHDKNLLFYLNMIRCEPDDLLIDELHEKWWNDYDTLEYNHGYIQWLFPIREYGMNFEAQPLEPHEITGIKESPEAMERVLKSYRLMLNFYGIKLVDEDTGLLARKENYKPHYENLRTSPHNNLRISRILKCLSELGLERLNAGFLLHVLNEQSEFRYLFSSQIQGSMDRFWVNCIRNEEERKWIHELLYRVRTGALEFHRQDYERVMLIRQETGHFQWRVEGSEGEPEPEEEEDQRDEEVEAWNVKVPSGSDLEAEGQQPKLSKKQKGKQACKNAVAPPKPAPRTGGKISNTMGLDEDILQSSSDDGSYPDEDDDEWQTADDLPDLPPDFDKNGLPSGEDGEDGEEVEQMSEDRHEATSPGPRQKLKDLDDKTEGEKTKDEKAKDDDDNKGAAKSSGLSDVDTGEKSEDKKQDKPPALMLKDW